MDQTARQIARATILHSSPQRPPPVLDRQLLAAAGLGGLGLLAWLACSQSSSRRTPW